MKKFIIIYIALLGLLDPKSSSVSKAESTEVVSKEPLGGYDVNKKVIWIPVRKIFNPLLFVCAAIFTLLRALQNLPHH